MMRRSHAKDDGSFNRSATVQGVKGAALIAVAFIIGVALLHTAPRPTNVSTTVPIPKTTTKPKPTVPGAAAAATSTTLAPARPPAQVRLLVANGTNVNGLGGKVRGQLNGEGYGTTRSAIDAPTKDHATTEIYYQPGFESDALQLATTLGVGPETVKPMPTPPPVPAALTDVDILVIAGNDIGSAAAPTTPGSTVAPAPPTTARRATTVAPTTTARPATTTTTVKR